MGVKKVTRYGIQGVRMLDTSHYIDPVSYFILLFPEARDDESVMQ